MVLDQDRNRYERVENKTETTKIWSRDQSQDLQLWRIRTKKLYSAAACFWNCYAIINHILRYTFLEK